MNSREYSDAAYVDDVVLTGYSGDSAPPTVSSSVRADANPTNASSLDFTVTFSEGVNGVDASDFSLTTTGGLSGASVTAVTPASGFNTVYTVTVSTGTGDGTIRLDVDDDDTIQDAADNPLGGSYSAGQVYTIDKTAPVTHRSPVPVTRRLLQPWCTLDRLESPGPPPTRIVGRRPWIAVQLSRPTRVQATIGDGISFDSCQRILLDRQRCTTDWSSRFYGQ